eukprot:jgi/Hompol1/5593/HPOL_004559-RA
MDTEADLALDYEWDDNDESALQNPSFVSYTDDPAAAQTQTQTQTQTLNEQPLGAEDEELYDENYENDDGYDELDAPYEPAELEVAEQGGDAPQPLQSHVSADAEAEGEPQLDTTVRRTFYVNPRFLHSGTRFPFPLPPHLHAIAMQRPPVPVMMAVPVMGSQVMGSMAPMGMMNRPQGWYPAQGAMPGPMPMAVPMHQMRPYTVQQHNQPPSQQQRFPQYSPQRPQQTASRKRSAEEDPSEIAAPKRAAPLNILSVAVIEHVAPQTTEAQIHKMASQLAPVSKITMLRDQGKAEVAFATADGAIKLRRSLNRSNLSGSILIISVKDLAA